MNNTLWNKRIPTLFGIILIIAGLGVTSFLVQTGVITIGRASPTQEPQNVRVTNVTDTSFSVSYTTTSSAPGVISVGNTPSLGQTVLDDRDQQSGTINSYRTHHLTVRTLKNQTKYYFSITSGKDTYLDGGKPFEVQTASPVTTSPTSQDPLTGKVVMPDGSAPSEAILYATTAHAQTLSVLLKPNGTYVLPMNAMRTDALNEYVSFTKTTVIQMLIVTSDTKSSVTILAGKVNPVPTISLSSDYDFSLGTNPIAPVASSSAQTRFPILSASLAQPTTTTQIITPKKDQGFTDAQPTFNGTATPNSTVTVTIHSTEQIQDQITADSTGHWNYRPKTPLSPGSHTITISTIDASGIMKTITQSFTVFAAGSQVSQSATPSATPTITAPTATPTPTPTPIRSTITLTPTPTPIVFIPTPTTPPVVIAKGGVITPSPQVLGNTTKGGKTLPAAGNSQVMVAGTGAILMTAIGLLIFFLSRGSISSI